MKNLNLILLVTSILVLVMLAFSTETVLADGDDSGDSASETGAATPNTNQPWQQAIDDQGNFTDENLEFVGYVEDYNAEYMQEATNNANWNSTVTQSSETIPARYIEFYDPASDTTYIIPDGTTAYYMAQNADSSPVGSMYGAVTTDGTMATQLYSNEENAIFTMPSDFSGSFLPNVNVNGQTLSNSSVFNTTYLAGPQLNEDYSFNLDNGSLSISQSSAIQESGNGLYSCLHSGGSCLSTGSYSNLGGYSLEQELDEMQANNQVIGQVLGDLLGVDPNRISQQITNQQMQQINNQLRQYGWECRGTTCMPSDGEAREAYLAQQQLQNQLRGLCARYHMTYCNNIIALPSGGTQQTPGGYSLPPLNIRRGPSSCGADQMIPGEIRASAYLEAPPYPIVVGQDDAKRGADLVYRLEIFPTILRTWQLRSTGTYLTCVDKPAGAFAPRGDCPVGQVKAYVTESWCEMTEIAYPESADWSMPAASLEEQSRTWILNTLASVYPGAYLHHPDWSWPRIDDNCGFVNSIYVCNYGIDLVQVADPGWYGMSILGQTNGTAVSPAREFNAPAGRFSVWLMQTTIIH